MYISNTLRRKLPSTQALVCFEAAARHESYTRAAQELALTQGAVYRQDHALEALVGIVLFRRKRHGVALTDSGRDYARQVARRLDALELETVNAMARQHSGNSLAMAAVDHAAAAMLESGRFDSLASTLTYADAQQLFVQP